MTVTEEEAKGKWCPMTVLIKRDNALCGEPCIASECMMWVWDTDWDTDEESKGHCGLAGGLT
jgi:hypothetical protein